MVQFPADRSDVEEEVVAAARLGMVIDLCDRSQADRTVAAGVIYDLCVKSTDVHAKGVRLVGALIMGPLDFGAAKLNVPLILTNCVISGESPDSNSVNLEQARGSWISFNECHVDGSVSAVQLSLANSLTLTGSLVGGWLDVTGADVSGTLVLDDADIAGHNGNGNSVVADGLRVGGSLLARGLRTAGAMRLPVSEICRTLEMDRARVNGSDADGDALIADGFTVKGNAVLRDGFFADGCVRMPGADVSGSLIVGSACINGADQDGNALLASRGHFGRVVFAQNVTFGGTVTFAEARIDGRLDVAGATSIPRLILKGARCAEFADSPESWPPNGQLVTVGFQFDRMDDDLGWAKRLEGVRRQGLSTWSSDPYEQLAAYYARTGNEAAARQIRIAMNDDELAHLKQTKKVGSLRYRFWRRPFGWLLGYGYRRWVAGWLLVGIVIIAGVGFWRLHEAGTMIPNVAADVATKPCGQAYRCFNAAVYGADVVLPIIDFGQESAWRPNSQAPWGWAADCLQWFSIASGWFLASIFVAAFTNLIRRD